MTKDWQELALKKLGEKNTYPAGVAPNKSFEEFPNFHVWEFSPNMKLDKVSGKPIKQGKRYLLAGRDWSIILQTSVIKALHDILGERLGFNFTFEDWWEQWERGFSKLSRTSDNMTKGLTSNYPADPKLSRQSTSLEAMVNKPGFIEWKNPRARLNPKWRVIEYFPNRSDNNTSYLCCGSDMQIVQQIISIEFPPKNSSGVNDGFVKTETPIMSGHPMVTLYFSSGKSQANGKRPIRSQISFRLMNKVELTEHSYQGESVLTEVDLQQIITKIKTKFSDSNYKIERGDTIYSYTFKPLGYRFWMPLRSQAEAIRLFTDVLSIQGHTLKPELVAESKKAARANTVPDKKVKIAGTDVTLSQAYKNADIWFTHATLKLPVSKHMKTLIINPRANY
jgi:hypothetical protein